MRKRLFGVGDKMADLIVDCHKVILILPRFGIRLGFGDRSVGEVCALYGVDSELFLMVCNIYAFPDYLPSHRTLTHGQVGHLLNYLQVSHHYYLEERVPHIENHVHRLAEACTPSQCNTLKRFFAQYKEEVEGHFSYEEVDVFPYVKTLLNGQQSKNFRINQFEENHSNIEDKLDDLTNIIIKYLPDETLPHERTSVLFDLFQLAADLKKHALIEDHLLVPAVEALEGGSI